jgi:hypothetical protein
LSKAGHSLIEGQTAKVTEDPMEQTLVELRRRKNRSWKHLHAGVWTCLAGRSHGNRGTALPMQGCSRERPLRRLRLTPPRFSPGWKQRACESLDQSEARRLDYPLL